MDDRLLASVSDSVTKRIYYELKWFLSLNRGGRNFKIYPDDRFLVSYPRSGNTWTRFLIANLLFNDRDVNFLNIDYLVPDILNITRRELSRVPRPRLIKSHEYFDPQYEKVIYIVRDPRDVAVSHYAFQLKLGYFQDGYPMGEFIRRWVAGEVDPYCASWGENVGSWLATHWGRPDFLLLTYEQMKADTARELAKVSDFLQIRYDQAALQKAIALSSAERMRELEKHDEERWIGTRKRRKDVRFVGKATTGGWRSVLAPEDVARIESAWAPIMRVLGYELSSNQSGQAEPLGELFGGSLVRP
jgi:hypothetical protein